MTVISRPVDYSDAGTVCKGTLYLPEGAGTGLPAVLVTPAWDGVVPEVHDKASRLAGEGYAALVVDVYGEGTTLESMDQMGPAVAPFMGDRRVLVRRMQAAASAAAGLPEVDANRIAAMGYCFGGLCVLDLARGGGDSVKGVVTFHGALLAPEPPLGETIRAKVLVLHGDDDPMVPPEQVEAFRQEMNAAGVDWQLVAYSQTVHAFTRPDANLPEMGAVYNATADARSWTAMLNFLDEVLAA